jgi:hypothetical protein
MKLSGNNTSFSLLQIENNTNRWKEKVKEKKMSTEKEAKLKRYNLRLTS